MVGFEGWALPIQYSNIIDEHNAVRNSAGIFDVSHMGEIDIVGFELKERGIPRHGYEVIVDDKKLDLLQLVIFHQH